MDNDLKSIQDARDKARIVSSAQAKFRDYPQRQVDNIIKAMVEAGFSTSEELARLAVEDTGMGVYEDKVLKNQFASRDVGAYIRSMKTADIVNEDRVKKVTTVAYPMGVVAALTPITNPTSTAIYKCLIALKGRNGIVLSPHPKAKRSTRAAANIMHETAIREGAPRGIIECMEHVTLEGSKALLTNKNIDVILATGGSAMVKAAYESGKPAYGVGPGNVPVYIDSTANVKKAVGDIFTGKCFDNGLICSTESNVVCHHDISDEVKEEFSKQGGWLLRPDQKDKLEKYVIRKAGNLNMRIIGQSAEKIAELAGIEIPSEIRCLIVELGNIGISDPLSREKLSPILGYVVAADVEEASTLCNSSLNYGGNGHTMVIHSADDKVVRRLYRKNLAYRIVVNSPAPHGSVGYTTDIDPALTLGSGTISGSITSDNINPLHLIHYQRIGYETKPLVAGVARRKFGDESGITKKGDFSRFEEEDRMERSIGEQMKYGTNGLSEEEVEGVIKEFSSRKAKVD